MGDRTYETAPGDVAAYDLRKPTSGQTDIPRLRAGRVGGQFWSVYVPGELQSGWARTQLEQIDIARRVIARYPDTFQLAGTAAISARPTPPGASPRSSEWRAGTPSRTRSARCAPTTISACAT